MSKHTDFSRIFIDRPILATVLSTLILVAGAIAIPNLPISEYPDVVQPSVQEHSSRRISASVLCA